MIYLSYFKNLQYPAKQVPQHIEVSKEDLRGQLSQLKTELQVSKKENEVRADWNVF
jgi:hypothetical protein